MPWQHIRISRLGGPEVLELAEQPTLPEPGPDEVRIKVLAAGTGFTDTFIRRGRYPDFNPLCALDHPRPVQHTRGCRTSHHWLKQPQPNYKTAALSGQPTDEPRLS